jgi:hypothetical protein
LIRDLDPVRLVAVEERWGPVRASVSEALDQLGMGIEHAHWDWRNKIDRAVRGQLLLSAVECEGEVQGLLAVAARPRFASLSPGDFVLYVDYIEKAPWNLPTPATPPRFGGIGTVLLADAVVHSRELGFEGRIGLHSLPSAESYYRNHCAMTDLGHDPASYDLRYFEYTSTAASTWLTNTGVPL